MIRDAIKLLAQHRPDLTTMQMIMVLQREYRHPAAGDTAMYLAENAEYLFPSPNSGEV